MIPTNGNRARPADTNNVQTIQTPPAAVNPLSEGLPKKSGRRAFFAFASAISHEVERGAHHGPDCLGPCWRLRLSLTPGVERGEVFRM